MKNILVIKLRYIGDVLLATPVLHSLKAANPQSRLTVAVNRGTEDILAYHPDVDEVLAVEKESWRTQLRFLSEIRRCRFDCVIDLTDADRSAVMTWFSGAPVRIGFNDEHRWRGVLYTEIVNPPAGHRAERDLAAAKALGIEAKPSLPVLRTSALDEEEAGRLLEKVAVGAGDLTRPLVMLHPGARYWFKAWPAERFAELADRLTECYGCRVLVGGGPQDRTMAEEIARRARSSPTVVAGCATLLQFASMLKRCSVFIGNDSGAMHVAAAVGTPVVALFGPSNPAEWGPLTERQAVLYKGMDCRACFHPDCRRGENNCMRLISVDEVFEAAARLVKILGNGVRG